MNLQPAEELPFAFYGDLRTKEVIQVLRKASPMRVMLDNEVKRGVMVRISPSLLAFAVFDAYRDTAVLPEMASTARSFVCPACDGGRKAAAMEVCAMCHDQYVVIHPFYGQGGM